MQERIAAAPLICVQNPYSLLNRSLESEMFPMVRAMGLGVMAYAPLATGLLSGAYTPGQEAAPETLWGSRRRGHLTRVLSGRPAEVLSTVRELADRHSATVAQVALKWVISRPEITVAISGADTDAQLAENLGAVDLALTPDELARLDAVSTGLGLALDGPEFHGPGR